MTENTANIVHVVYASDDRFAGILGVSLISLYENSSDLDGLNIYILDSGISSENHRRIESICHQYNSIAPVWIQARDISRELSMEVTVDRGSLSQYARLFVSSVLPPELERVLYLDCDIIVNHSIHELWNLDMQGKTIAALMDAFSRQYRVNLDLQSDDIMFNSGVMLIDLKRWREQHVEEHLLAFIAARKGKIQQGDQGVLNAVLSHDTYCFAPRFNSVTIFFDFTYREMLIYRKPPCFYKETEIQQAIEDPVIIHFTTSFLSKRPWMEGCHHRYAGRWLEFKAKSPWSDVPLEQDNRPEWRQKGVIIYKRLPSGLMLRIAGVLQAYGRPIFNRISLRKG